MAECIGTVALLQVQVEPLKASGVYEPQHLLKVDRASLSADGMLGRDGTRWVVDAHHTRHPRSRAGGRRAMSIGFTGHYAAMGDRFGSVDLGIGGENLVVDGPPFRLQQIKDGFIVRGDDGEVELLEPRPATPCAEFTSHLLGSPVVLPRRQISADLAFLDDGTRGFIVSVRHLTAPVLIEIGDEVWLR